MKPGLPVMNHKPPSLAYALGRKAAPLFFKAQWIMQSLTGSEQEKIAAEYKMGYLLAQVYEEKIPAAENNRLAKISGQLVSSLRNKDRRFSFKCDQSGVPNALAIPGGFIYLSEKLFDLCGEDIDAIAFVLAHEIAHTIHGDANKRFLTKTAINALLRFRTRGISPPVQSLLAHLVQQGYSREQEYRADRFAVALTKAAGFDPKGGCRLFSNLRKHEKEPNFMGEYFSSHPALSDRIDRINRRMQQPE